MDLSTLRDHDDHQDIDMVPLGDTPAVLRYVSAGTELLDAGSRA